MKIVYDDIVYSLQKTGGVSVMWSEITRNPPFPATHIRYSDTDRNMFAEKTEGHEYEILNAKGLIAKRYFNIRRHEETPFLFHSSYYRYCLDPKAINITNIYDCTFERYFHAPIYKVHLYQKKKTIMHSDGIICISNNTKKDLLEFYPEYKGEVAVVYCGYDTGTYYFEDTGKEPIILFVGSRTFYKRFDLAVKIVKGLPDYKLVVIGGGSFNPKEQALLDSELPGRYEKKGFLNNDELRSLYNKAHFLLYCSDYEGFGIPPLEAQACGCPVVCQARSSLPEVVGDAAVFYNPEDEQRSMEAIRKLNQPDYYADIVSQGLENAKRFSWEACSRGVHDFYQYMLEKRPSR